MQSIRNCQFNTKLKWTIKQMLSLTKMVLMLPSVNVVGSNTNYPDSGESNIIGEHNSESVNKGSVNRDGHMEIREHGGLSNFKEGSVGDIAAKGYNSVAEIRDKMPTYPPKREAGYFISECLIHRRYFK